MKTLLTLVVLILFSDLKIDAQQLKTLSGSLTCDKIFYSPNSKLILTFTLSSSTPDLEYIDSLALTFPSGFTIDSASSSIGNEWLNPIIGNIVS